MGTKNKHAKNYKSIIIHCSNRGKIYKLNMSYLIFPVHFTKMYDFFPLQLRSVITSFEFAFEISIQNRVGGAEIKFVYKRMERREK